MPPNNSPKAELRRQAEAKLSERKKIETAPSATEADTRRLVHELQVHQIELETQNEQLVQARAESGTALRQYTDLYDSAPVGYFTLARDGAIRQVNLPGANLLGVECGGLINRRFGLFVSVESRPIFSAFLEKVFSMCGSKETCEVALQKDGSAPHWAHIEAITEVEQREVCLAVVVDITERKRAEEALREGERQIRFQAELLQNAPVIAAFHDRELNVVWANKAYEDATGLSVQAMAGRKCYSVWKLARACRNCPVVKVIETGEPYEAELTPQNQDHWPESQGYWLSRAAPVRDADGSILGAIEIAIDITERKQAEEALKKAAADWEATFDATTDGIYLLDSDQRIIRTNKALERMFNIREGDAAGKFCWQIIHGTSQPIPDCPLIRAKESKQRESLEYKFGERYFEFVVDPILDDSGALTSAVHIVRDITERKRAEETLRQRLAELESLHTVSAALRAAQTRDEALPILLDETLAVMETEAGVIWLYYPEHDELYAAVARGWFQQLSETPLKPGEGIAGTVFASGQSYVSTEFRTDPTIAPATTRAQIPAGWGGVCVPIRSGAITVGVLFVSVPPPRQISPEQVKLLESLAEMAGASLHRMSLYEATVRQLDQLQSLHDIDLAITASMDLRMTLNVLLLHVLTQLKVDAANVLLLNPHLQTLEYAAGRGFRTDALKNTRLRLGEGYAGRAALERKLVHIPDLRGRKTDFLRSPFFSAEGFVAYYGMPLIAKGQVKGVLEIFHRAPLAAGPDWVNLLETLTGQTAIAIDNSQLFDNLQRSNMDLVLAYDATIKGWSRALDLRDRETEGHTQRVTELTERLARAMDISEAEIVHIRRGALLHDIGKMGVPDGILLKPDKLTDDEWVLMRKHPQFGFDMLAPITYLKPALDIPFCHHEKWDGSGYPRGLKGEQIPLAARLFAVVDVWDALRSDRPYREAWPEEKALEYIHAESGKHFDPQVVKVFERKIGEG